MAKTPATADEAKTPAEFMRLLAVRMRIYSDPFHTMSSGVAARLIPLFEHWARTADAVEVRVGLLERELREARNEIARLRKEGAAPTKRSPLKIIDGSKP